MGSVCSEMEGGGGEGWGRGHRAGGGGNFLGGRNFFQKLASVHDSWPPFDPCNFLRFPAVSCGFLRFPAVSCCFLRLCIVFHGSMSRQVPVAVSGSLDLYLGVFLCVPPWSSVSLLFVPSVMWVKALPPWTIVLCLEVR